MHAGHDLCHTPKQTNRTQTTDTRSFIDDARTTAARPCRDAARQLLAKDGFGPKRKTTCSSSRCSGTAQETGHSSPLRWGMVVTTGDAVKDTSTTWHPILARPRGRQRRTASLRKAFCASASAGLKSRRCSRPAEVRSPFATGTSAAMVENPALRRDLQSASKPASSLNRWRRLFPMELGRLQPSMRQWRPSSKSRWNRRCRLRIGSLAVQWWCLPIPSPAPSTRQLRARA